MAPPRNSSSTVTGRLMPRMVSWPSTCQVVWLGPGRMAVLEKLMVGWSSVPKKSLERRWPSRVASPVVMVVVSSSSSRVESSGPWPRWRRR